MPTLEDDLTEILSGEFSDKFYVGEEEYDCFFDREFVDSNGNSGYQPQLTVTATVAKLTPTKTVLIVEELPYKVLKQQPDGAGGVVLILARTT